MQSSMEKMVEQSSTALRDRAAEVSSLLASELDHYRRTYLEHSTAQIEDSAKEIVTPRTRQDERNGADGHGRIFRPGASRHCGIAADGSSRFRARRWKKRARTWSSAARVRCTEYQKVLDERMMQGVEQATVSTCNRSWAR